MKKIYTAILAVLLIAGCSSKDNNSEAEKLNIKIDTTVTFGPTIALADFQLKVPTVWVSEKPASDMRVVQYFLKHYSSVNVLGFYFGDRPQMADANIERWKGEFSKVTKVEDLPLNVKEIKLVSISGTFRKKASMMSEEATDAPNWMTLAAIVPSFQGPYFFKMVGPQQIVEKEIPRFKGFLNSYQKINMNPHGM